MENKYHTAIVSKIENCLAIAKREFGTELSVSDIHVTYNLRGKTAGRAKRNSVTSYKEIALNAALLDHNSEGMIHQTVPHEVAHLVAWTIWTEYNHNNIAMEYHIAHIAKKPYSGHGPMWAHVMRTFGLEPRVRHKYDISVVETAHQRTYVYTCSCGKHYVTPIKHKAIQDRAKRGGWNRCVTCNAIIVFTGGHTFEHTRGFVKND